MNLTEQKNRLFQIDYELKSFIEKQDKKEKYWIETNPQPSWWKRAERRKWKIKYDKLQKQIQKIYYWNGNGGEV